MFLWAVIPVEQLRVWCTNLPTQNPPRCLWQVEEHEHTSLVVKSSFLNAVLSSSMHLLHSYSDDGIRPKTMSTLKVALFFRGPLARGRFEKSKSIFLKEIPSIPNDTQALYWSFDRLWFWNHWLQNLFLVVARSPVMNAMLKSARLLSFWNP